MNALDLYTDVVAQMNALPRISDTRAAYAQRIREWDAIAESLRPTSAEIRQEIAKGIGH